MIVIDTNVLSELLRRSPEPAVLGWFDKMPAESLWVTSITVFEIRTGLESMRPGPRRIELEGEFLRTIDEDFDNRVLVFDRAAADEAGRIAGERRRAGRPVEIRDLQIAGIVGARKASFATRNVRHFEGVGLTIVNPWTA